MIDQRAAAPAAVEAFPLSTQQRRLWQLESAGASLRSECVVALSGPLAVGALAAALAAVADRHEALRTAFVRRRGMRLPFQAVQDTVPELETAPAGEGWGDLCERQRRLPFDLEGGRPLHASLLRVGPDEHVLYLGAPALCADGASLDSIVRDLARAYAGPAAGADLGAAASPMQYIDYADWQSELLAADDEEARRGREHWRGLPPAGAAAHLLPGQRRKEGRRFRPAVLELGLEPEFRERVHAAAAILGSSLEDWTLACWQALLWRLTQEPLVVVAVRADGRSATDLAGAVGPFARWLPIVSRLAADPPFDRLVEETAHAVREAREWQDYAPAGDEETALPFGFEFDRRPAPVRAAEVTFAIRYRRAFGEPFAAALALVEGADGTVLELRYDAAALPAPAAERLAAQLRTLMASAAAAPRRHAGSLELLPDHERRLLLVEVNATRVEFEPSGAVHRRFEREAARRPDGLAAVCGAERVSYRELNGRANQLARHLRGLGVGPEVRVALFLERSLDVLVGLLGVLKSGGAYVPLDLAQPEARLADMLADAGAPVLVTEERLRARVPAAAGLRVVTLDGDRERIAAAGTGDPPAAGGEEHLAYVLFTSGSTGRPKGVAVEHRQLANYVDAVVRRLGLPPAAGFAGVTTIAADLGHTALFPALTTGGCFHLIAEETAQSPEALADYFARHEVDGLKIVPSHLKALLAASGDPARLLPRRWLVLGGEPCGWELVETLRRLAPDLAVLNHYGPTEATVGALTQWASEVPEGEERSPGIPLGRPLANVRCYLVDARLQPVATGVEGEICLAGAGLARGYPGRPEETAARFIPDPWSGDAGSRLYRTGDLGRFSPEGLLEFRGRTDHQVKIRGFRVEIGGIEAALAGHPELADALVVLRDGEPGGRRLVTYAVPRPGCAPSAASVAAFLRQRLPDYMVPPAFVLLPELPLTPNGKVDRSALPEPERAAPARESFVAPRDAAEEALAAIWKEVLKLPRVGIHDSFFALGGDSILSIEVIARANRAGIQLTPRQIFQHQTIAELAAAAGTAAPLLAEQGRVSGEVPLTPVQHRFFEQRIGNRNHWNQALLLTVSGTRGETVAAALGHLVAHHDALTLRFVPGDSGWRQVHGEARSSWRWSWVDLAGLPAASRPAAVTAAAEEAQRGLHLEQGPVLRAVWFAGAGSARLLLVAHHLVVDGVSWRVLLDDLATACEQLAAGAGVRLPAKTSSYKSWAERLARHATSEEAERALASWMAELPSDHPALPVDGPDAAPGRAGDVAYVSASLSPEETGALLQEAPAAYRARLHELLVAALVEAMADWTERPAVLLEIEGHGREPLFDELDVSRTIGWFAAHFPVLFERPGQGDPAGTLRYVKERLRAVTDNGLGHGILLYLGGEAAAARLRTRSVPQVLFNYLGRLEPSGDGPARFHLSGEPVGATVDPAAPRPRLLEVVGSVSGGRLQTVWAYSPGCHRAATVERLAHGFLEALRVLLSGCRAAGPSALAPSDFPLAGLDQQRLDKVMGQLLKDRKGS